MTSPYPLGILIFVPHSWHSSLHHLPPNKYRLSPLQVFVDTSSQSKTARRRAMDRLAGVYSWMRLRPRDTLQTDRERERESSQVLFPYLQELHFARCYLLSNFPVSHFSFTQFLSLLFETSCFQQEHQSLYLLQTILISLPTLPFSFPSFPFIFTYPSPFLFKLLASYGCGSSGLVVSC